MSNPDDRAFDVYLARGSNLSQHYRDEAAEKPGAAIDSLILTASRRAKVSMADMAVAPWYKRWRAPLAFAAVLVLGVGMTLRSVLQETKLGEPPPVVPAPKPESMPAPAPADAPSQPAGGMTGGTLSTPKDSGAGIVNEVAKEKSSESKDIIVEQEAAKVFPPAPAPVLEDKARAATPMPELNGPRPVASLGLPRTGAAPGKGAVESQAGSGSSGTVLDDAKSERRVEQDTQADKAASEFEKHDGDVLARRRDQALPRSAEEAAPPAVAPAPAPLPAEADVKAKRLEELGNGPRLPEGYSPIVDGKTFRANSAEAKRQTEEKKKQRAPAAVVDDAAEAPEAWLRRVAELRRLGRDEEAKAELERFRKRYPDYPAPAER